MFWWWRPQKKKDKTGYSEGEDWNIAGAEEEI
jgi:hypothetical protein